MEKGLDVIYIQTPKGGGIRRNFDNYLNFSFHLLRKGTLDLSRNIFS
ncbi:MAG: hypothetical protein MJ252_29890 [archaeon]|nr:hypothetical protein [archaeon]